MRPGEAWYEGRAGRDGRIWCRAGVTRGSMTCGDGTAPSVSTRSMGSSRLTAAPSTTRDHTWSQTASGPAARSPSRQRRWTGHPTRRAYRRHRATAQPPSRPLRAPPPGVRGAGEMRPNRWRPSLGTGASVCGRALYHAIAIREHAKSPNTSRGARARAAAQRRGPCAAARRLRTDRSAPAPAGRAPRASSGCHVRNERCTPPRSGCTHARFLRRSFARIASLAFWTFLQCSALKRFTDLSKLSKHAHEQPGL